ncbi:LacI family DNA-binding transcriptional regulator [Microbacterium mangrovi]|uniref:LacI family DNA-binding transcriptional regulator n=1 Tax=Microbacterium mangrovi TaxID=1348253 RepID=UPI00068CF3F1|nr:LacI family DNA-binding transcriptional regulator [Microbacterium mangrovi]
MDSTARPRSVARPAARLARGRTHTIGVFLLGLHNPVFADIYAGIAEGVAGSGEQLMVAVGAAESDAGTDVDPEREAQAIGSFVDLRVDGILLAGYTGTPEALETLLRGTPAVVITRELSAPGVDSVLADDQLGGSLAVEFLNELGHTRIAHVASRSTLPYGSRRAGYLDAMTRLGLEPLIVEENMTEHGGRRAMEQILRSASPRPTAVFANNDLAALGVLAALSNAGLSAPEDVSVIGYDDTALARSDVVQLSSVDQHGRGLGRIAAEQLLRRIAGEDGASVVRRFPPRIVPRHSVAPPASGS